jgi:hypothetical protein
VSCRLFRPDGHPAEGSPHHCALLGLPLARSDLRVDCPEHELVASWSVRGWPRLLLLFTRIGIDLTGMEVTITKLSEHPMLPIQLYESLGVVSGPVCARGSQGLFVSHQHQQVNQLALGKTSVQERPEPLS